MIKVSILQSNYIPWKGYFDLIARSDIFLIYDEVQYTKNDWRNRNLIKTSAGLQWLTIPVRQEKLDQKIFETKVLANNWQKKHINSLKINYSKATKFEELCDEIFDVYKNSTDFLSEINLAFIKKICKLLGIKTLIMDSRELQLAGDRNTRLVEACSKLGAGTYISGPAAKSYLDVSLFNNENINVEWMDYSGYKEYTQLYPPFEHGVSILDLIFSKGMEAGSYLKYIKNTS